MSLPFLILMRENYNISNEENKNASTAFHELKQRVNSN